MTINPDWTFVDLVEAMGHDVLDLETFVVWYCRRVHYLGVHWSERYEQRMRMRVASANAWLDADVTRTHANARARFGVHTPLPYNVRIERQHASSRAMRHKHDYRDIANELDDYITAKMLDARPKWQRDGLDFVAALILTGGLPLQHGHSPCVVGQLVKVATHTVMNDRVAFWVDELDLEPPASWGWSKKLHCRRSWSGFMRSAAALADSA